MRRPLFDLGEKVQLLGNALYTSYIEDELRIPVCVVHDFAMPEEDVIRFKVRKPYQNIDGMERRFYSTLAFYNKRCDFYLRLHGYSEVAEWQDDELEGRQVDSSLFPVTMRITSIDYQEATEHSSAGRQGQQFLHPTRAMLRKLWDQMNLTLKFPHIDILRHPARRTSLP